MLYVYVYAFKNLIFKDLEIRNQSINISRMHSVYNTPGVNKAIYVRARVCVCVRVCVWKMYSSTSGSLFLVYIHLDNESSN